MSSRKCFGKNLFHIKPILVGGDPTDLKNIVFLERKKHIELVNYWNKKIKQIRDHQQSSPKQEGN